MAAPIKTYRSGGVSLNIWQNEKDGKSYHSFSFQKSYKDDAGEWKNSTSFGLNDLLHIAMLIKTLFVNMITKGSEGAGR